MPDPAHLTVLVIDDEEGMRRVLRKVLAGLGIDRVEVAADIESALSLLREGSTPCDVAFCDLQMPGGGSATLLRELARLPACPDIILMSGAGSAALDQAGTLAAELKLTVAGKLQKPFTQQDVADVLGVSGRLGGPAVADVRPALRKASWAPDVTGVPPQRVRDFTHEASAPLMAINMLSGLLLDDESLPAAQRDDVKQIQRAATELARMLSRLRDEASASPVKSDEDT